jgi:tetrahydromethanopterin S-methyltransferase subunit H
LLGCCSHRHRGSNTATHAKREAGMILAYMPAQPYVALSLLFLVSAGSQQDKDMTCLAYVGCTVKICDETAMAMVMGDALSAGMGF